jgi:hypothetical protein
MKLKERIQKEITIFNRRKDLILPPGALEPSILPDDLQAYFNAVFGRERKRGEFPKELLDMQWKKCMITGCNICSSRFMS